MKKTWLLIIGLTVFNAYAGELTNSVPVTANLIFSLAHEKTGLPQREFKSDAIILFRMAAMDTNYVKYLAFPYEQAFDFKMFDEKKHEVPKTERGLANSKSASALKDLHELDRLKGQVLGSDLRVLFRSDEMFVITNKGVYDLEVRIRICVPMTNGVPDTQAMTPNKWHSNTHYGVVESASVRVHVVKE